MQMVCTSVNADSQAATVNMSSCNNSFLLFFSLHFVALLIAVFFFACMMLGLNIFIRVKAKAIYCHLLFVAVSRSARYNVLKTVMCNMFIVTGAGTRINLFNFLNCSTSACWIFPDGFSFHHSEARISFLLRNKNLSFFHFSVVSWKIILLYARERTCLLKWTTRKKKIIFWLSSLEMKQTTKNSLPCSLILFAFYMKWNSLTRKVTVKAKEK